MASSTALAFIFLGPAVAMLGLGWIAASQVCAFIATCIGLITLSGYTYGFIELITFGGGTLVPFPATIAIMVAGAAVFLSRPPHGTFSVLLSPRLGGKVIRRLWPLVILVPSLGFLTGIGASSHLDLVILVLLTTVLFPLLVLFVSRTIDILDWRKDLALHTTSLRSAELEEMNRDLQIARDDALEASRVKSTFVANISHELRTPISGVIGTNELLLGKGTLKTEEVELLQNAQDCARSLEKLVNDLLDISKIESGQFSIEQSPFDPSELVRSAAALFSRIAQAKQLTLVVRVNPAMPAPVVGDPERIKQVLLNLIDNAIKFTERGEITVAAESSRVAPESPEACLTFSVHDTGIGISEEEQKLLFAPFSQVDSSATRRFGGAGLGLWLSKGLVSLMGGSIGMTSKKGEGSTFWFAVPCRLSPSLQPVREAMPSLAVVESLRNKRILVVEDSPVLQKIVVKQLCSLGMDARAASTGIEAMDAFRKGEFDLILMDCNLPDISGLDITKMIREQENGTGHHIPIIAITAAAMVGDREKCIAAGMDDYLSKPVTVQQLQEKLKDWLQQ